MNTLDKITPGHPLMGAITRDKTERCHHCGDLYVPADELPCDHPNSFKCPRCVHRTEIFNKVAAMTDAELLEEYEELDWYGFLDEDSSETLFWCDTVRSELDYRTDDMADIPF